MSIPTLKELEDAKLPRVRFKEGNRAGYFMDHSFWRTLPDEIEFFVKAMKSHKTQVELLARGFGVAEDYGNGSIFISVGELRKWTDGDVDSLPDKADELSPCPVCKGAAELSFNPDLHVKCTNAKCGIQLNRRWPWASLDHTSEGVIRRAWNELKHEANSQ